MDLRFSDSRIDRRKIGDQIAAYWMKNSNSRIGIQYLQLQDGLVCKGRYSIERKDIGHVLIFNGKDHVSNVFVNADGSYQIDFCKVALTPELRRQIDDYCKKFYADNKEFCDSHTRFFKEKPWEACYGQTPQRALATLHNLGW